VNTHKGFLAALHVADDNAFLVYADLVQELYGPDRAEQIRDVISRTADAIRGEDQRARERAEESRLYLIRVGHALADRDVRECRAAALSERLCAHLNRPSSVGVPQAR
jgi:uncharacterized protein (TIGR02996 family)